MELRQFGTGNLMEFLPTAEGEPARVEWSHDDFSGTIKHYWTEVHEEKERNCSEDFNLAGTVTELRAFFAAVTSVRDQMRAEGFEV